MKTAAKKKKSARRKPLTEAQKKAQGKIKQDPLPTHAKSLADLPEHNQRHAVPPTEHLWLLRNQAMMDYVTDPDRRTAQYHFNRSDRSYGDHVAFKTFTGWSADDKWVTRREAFWNQLTVRLIERRQDALLELQEKEIDRLTETWDALIEHVRPLRDKNGKVRTYPKDHEHAGLPMLAHEITSYPKAVKAFLEIDERLMTKRGEVTQRSESVVQAVDGDTEALDPVTRTAKVTPEQMRALARQVLLKNQPELQKMVIDLDDEDVSGEDEA